MKLKAKYALSLTDYLVSSMNKAGLENLRLPKGILVTFPKPSEAICKRYMLACDSG